MIDIQKGRRNLGEVLREADLDGLEERIRARLLDSPVEPSLELGANGSPALDGKCRILTRHLGDKFQVISTFQV